MRILLVGEFSGVHSQLCLELRDLGHQVITLSDGDGYKKFDADILVGPKKYKSYVARVLYTVLMYLGIAGVFRYLHFRRVLDDIGSFDCIQLINPVSIPAFGAIGNFLLIRRLKKRCSRLFLCALGDDRAWVVACISGVYKYSPFDNLRVKTFFRFAYSLKYLLSPLFVALDIYACKSADAIVPGLADYAIAHHSNKKLVDKISLPVGEKHFKKPEPTKRKITIFHAWQEGKDYRKGNHLFHEAVKKLMARSSRWDIKYIVAQGLTFDEYVSAYSTSDIYLDQAYSYDRGVAGALGMCAGKVVFSGFEGEETWCAPYITRIGVNATPSVERLYECLLFLMDNTAVIDEIKLAAYQYAQDHYNANVVAKKYLQVWFG